ncbi:V4R domain-containing protein [Halalkalibacter krulwichiae]|uniref:V4R domain protein n=1 Tax=Halalkalibacter krulwichiae TaxID=199441 RepID=A0A1X9M8X9_9BACI|nr:V4R domain-containing protein [Halalkalibacter krulwichiae]ARK29875.1 V4R domain protein [Halalkalibacter krulwichiae]
MSKVFFDSSETKTILMSANAFHTLKNNLYNNIGSYKTKGFLFRFGKEFGIESAKNKSQNKDSTNPVGKRHSRLGHVKDVIFMGEIVRHPDGQIECIDTWGQWVESFEAELHLKNYGLANECVCHMLCGFASGALTYEYGESIIAIERKCVAKGDSCCEFEVRLEQDWLEEQEELIHLYQNDNILTELEMTYDSLLHHKKMIEKISTFHSQLTQKVTEKHSMDEIVQEAYELLNIPILIEDIHGNLLSQIGLTERQLETINREKLQLSLIDDKHNVKHYKGSTYWKLIAPVLINKNNYATCSFFYFDGKRMDENDHLFLERISMVLALYILYEEAQFEEQQRIRSSLLERLIHNRKIKGIESYYKFLPFKLQPPFSTGIISVQKKKKNNEIIDIHDQLIQLSKLAKDWDLPCIFAILGEEIALLNSQNIDKKSWKNTITKIFKKVEKQNSNYKYSLGLSGTFSNLKDFERSLKEALVAQRFPNQKLLTDYEDLGILGDIVMNMSIEQLHEMAQKTLKDLYDFNDPRKKELLYTLYIYLLNGQRLKETVNELTLSIGGIQYRIKQIEDLLQISLKNASTAAYILLVIQALILSDSLTFEEFKR